MLQLSVSSKKNNLKCSIQGDTGKLSSEKSLFSGSVKNSRNGYGFY